MTTNDKKNKKNKARSIKTRLKMCINKSRSGSAAKSSSLIKVLNFLTS